MTPNAVSNVYLLLGPDRPRKLARVAELAAAWSVGPLDRHDLSGAECAPAALLALARGYPALARRRLIVLDDAQRVDAGGWEALRALAREPDPTSCVVALCEEALPKSHPALAPGSGIAVETCGAEPEPADPFALTKALARRDLLGAWRAAEARLNDGDDALEVLGLVAWQVSRWLAVAQAREAGCARDAMPSLLGLSDWQVDRILDEIRVRSCDELAQALTQCWRVDVAAKSGGVPSRAGLERVLASLCAGAGR